MLWIPNWVRPLAKRLSSEPGSDALGSASRCNSNKRGLRQQQSFSSSEFHALLHASAFGQCVAHLHVVPTEMLRFGDGLLPSFSLSVHFKDSKRSSGHKMASDPHCDVPSPLTSPASLSSDGTEGFGQSDQTGRSKQERLFAKISEELVWPLCLFEKAEVFQGTLSYRSSSTENDNTVASCLSPLVTSMVAIYIYIALLGKLWALRFVPELRLASVRTVRVEVVESIGGALRRVWPHWTEAGYSDIVGSRTAKDYAAEVEEVVSISKWGGQRTPLSVDTDAAGRARTRVLSRRLSVPAWRSTRCAPGCWTWCPGIPQLFTWEECAGWSASPRAISST